MPRASSSRARASSPDTRNPSSSVITSVATFFPTKLVAAASGDFPVDRNLKSAAAMLNAATRNASDDDDTDNMHAPLANVNASVSVRQERAWRQAVTRHRML